jgi:hypothetical protein
MSETENGFTLGSMVGQPAHCPAEGIRFRYDPNAVGSIALIDPLTGLPCVQKKFFQPLLAIHQPLKKGNVIFSHPPLSFRLVIPERFERLTHD